MLSQKLFNLADWAAGIHRKSQTEAVRVDFGHLADVLRAQAEVAQRLENSAIAAAAYQNRFSVVGDDDPPEAA